MNSLTILTQTLFTWTWKTSAYGTLLILLVFFLQKVLARWLTPRWRYALSLLVLARLLLPMAPTSGLSVENLLPPAARFIPYSSDFPASRPSGAHAISGAASVVSQLPGPAVGQPAFLSVPEAGCMIWAFGLAGLLVLGAWRWGKWNQLMQRGRLVSDPKLLALLSTARADMGVAAPITLVAVPRLSSPAIFGLWQCRLLIPETVLSQLNLRELRMIFLHELAHVRRKDVLLNYLLMGVQFLHWFNPLVWLALHRLRADRELVCDAMAMQRLGAEERLAYGNVLLKLMEGFSPEFRGFFGAVPVISSLAEIKRRIVMIKNHRTASLAVCLTMALLVLALALVAFTHAPGPGATRHVSGEDLVLPGGPSYHGQSLGHWTCQLKQGNLQGQAEAREALRTLATNAVPTLVGWLRTAPPQWSGYAATALGELGPSASNAIPALESIASGPPPRDAAAAAALMKIRGQPMDGLIRALDNPDSDRVGTAQILAEFGTNASPAIPALCRGLDSEHGWAAAYAIGYIHSQPEIAVPALIAAINQEDAKGERNKNSMNNLNRIWALGEFESEASLAIPILRQHLNDFEPMIRQSALGSLRRILPPSQLKTLVPVLVQNARDSNPNLSVVARSLLFEIDPMAARKVALQKAIQESADKFYRKWLLSLRE